ncbi:MAG: serpin family protein [Candidatus Aceula lacicola]|nr:serpin family protein [Candidatus Aceula lacicola]
MLKKRIYFGIFKVVAVFLFFAIALFFVAANVSAQDKSDIDLFVKGNNRFALNLYGELKSDEGNLFLSPYSISTALAMTFEGAAGETQRQMADVLHFDMSKNRVGRAFLYLAQGLSASANSDGYELNIANALWGEKTYTFLPEFLNQTKEFYGGALRNLDFLNETEKSRQIINAWVEEKTKNKIKNLIGPGVLSPATRLVLTNAIYFKGDWMTPFKNSDTFDRLFYFLSGESASVPTMNQMAHFNYAEDGDVQVLEMPYKGNRLSMVIILSKERDGISALEQKLTGQNLAKWISSLKSQDVNVSLPKFEATVEFSLAKTLEGMGMRDAFLPVADFSGMSGNKDLFISDVIHKAFVKVDEKGTEAAAATAVVMTFKGVMMPQETKKFTADHSFIFMIRDMQTKSILFIGRIMDPRS